MLQTKLSREELDLCKRSPLYYYNTYMRPASSPVLTQEQYNEMILQKTKQTVKIRSYSLNRPKRTLEVTYELIDDEDIDVG